MQFDNIWMVHEGQNLDLAFNNSLSSFIVEFCFVVSLHSNFYIVLEVSGLADHGIGPFAQHFTEFIVPKVPLTFKRVRERICTANVRR